MMELKGRVYQHTEERVWTDIEMTALQFFREAPKIIERAKSLQLVDGELDDMGDALSSLCFQFNGGTYSVVESFSFTHDGERIGLSSFDDGIVEWNNEQQQYVRHYHFSERGLGQLRKVKFRLDEKAAAIFNLEAPLETRKKKVVEIDPADMADEGNE